MSEFFMLASKLASLKDSKNIVDKKRECEDCGDEVPSRRLRCKDCGKLVCNWCAGHVHRITGEESIDD